MATAAINGIGLVLGVLAIVPLIQSLIPPTPAELKMDVKIVVGRSAKPSTWDKNRMSLFS
jgi:hypothetical protein